MPAKKVAKEDNDYTPQELLTAAAMEYKKLEAANQVSVERMYGALSSPFKVANKPCEVSRAAVIQCFENILGKNSTINDKGTMEPTVGSSGSSNNIHLDSNNNDNINKNNNNNSGEGASFSVKSDFPPVHRCYDAVLQYEACVLEKTLAKHHSLVASFETRRIHEAESAQKASSSTSATNGV